MIKTPESLVPPTSCKKLKRFVAAGVGLTAALALVGCGSSEKDTGTDRKAAPSASASPHGSGAATSGTPEVSGPPNVGTGSNEATPQPPAVGGAFATRRVCEGIYVADKGARVILRPVVNQDNKVLDIAEQSAGGVDFMPEPLTASQVEWFQLDGQPFPEDKKVTCHDQALFMNEVLQPNGHRTWQMSSVNHDLLAHPTQMPWDPNAIRGSFKGVHFDEGKLSCAALVTVVPGYNPQACLPQ